jgi:hypothetical protein
VACFLVSATTPRSDLLIRLGFHPTDQAGVYGHNDHLLLKAMQVILLNELTPAAHNAVLKCFASRRKEQEVSSCTRPTGLAAVGYAPRTLM